MNIQTRNTKENTMNSQAQPYQPLTSENAAVVLVDHQVGLMTGVRDYSTGELKHNVVALAKAAKALKLPIVVTTTARDSMWGRPSLSWWRPYLASRSSTDRRSMPGMIPGWLQRSRPRAARS